MISGAKLAELANVNLFNPDVPPVGDLVATSTWARSITAGISMVGALAIMLPVTWVYMVTRRQRGYSESVVHPLPILPVAVTGLVTPVQAPLALAFSRSRLAARHSSNAALPPGTAISAAARRWRRASDCATIPSRDREGAVAPETACTPSNRSLTVAARI